MLRRLSSATGCARAFVLAYGADHVPRICATSHAELDPMGVSMRGTSGKGQPRTCAGDGWTRGASVALTPARRSQQGAAKPERDGQGDGPGQQPKGVDQHDRRALDAQAIQQPD